MSALYRLSMKPNFKYIQKVSRAFHISSAILESGKYAKLYLTINSTKVEVASLSLSVPEKSLDLTFLKGDKLIFHIVGKGDITLVGYTLPSICNEPNDDDNDDAFEDEDEEDDGYDDDDIEEHENSDVSVDESDEDSGIIIPRTKRNNFQIDNPLIFDVLVIDMMHAPPKKKLRLSLGQCPKPESMGDADVEMSSEDAGGDDVQMNTEEN